jgi:hypothetical protein
VQFLPQHLANRLPVSGRHQNHKGVISTMRLKHLGTSARILSVLAASSAGVGLANVAATSSVAHADPAFVTALSGVGSDTIQDVFDAYSGADPYPGSPSGTPLYYTALNAGTSSASTDVSVASWDAIPAGGTAAAPGSIATKLGGPSFDRPNGSSNGITALFDAVTSTPWVASTGDVTGPVSVTGQIDFARSSRGPKTAGTTLTWIPFARDAVSVAYFVKGTANLATITTAQLQTIYTNGSISIGGDTVIGCLPQAGSGTRSFFETAINVSDTTAAAAATANGCNSAEENGANSFATFANGLGAGTDAVIPFSVGSWISQANGVALDRSASGRTAGVNLADIDNIDGTATPYNGTAPTETANTTFYSNTQYGRNVFVVAPTTKVTGFGANAAYKGLFVGATSAICSASAQTTANKFGFDSLIASEGTCGSTTQQGNN